MMVNGVVENGTKANSFENGTAAVFSSRDIMEEEQDDEELGIPTEGLEGAGFGRNLADDATGAEEDEDEEDLWGLSSMTDEELVQLVLTGRPPVL